VKPANSLEVATRLYQLLDGDDIPAVLELCDQDVIIQYPAVGMLPYGGTWLGHDGVARFLEIHDVSEEILEFEVARLITDGDDVMVLGTFRGRAKRGGREWATPFVHHLTAVGGRLSRWEAFFDTAAAVEARR
jgi:uncharacterized protein